MVMLSHLNIDISAVTDCLHARFNTSGIEEKATRGQQQSAKK
jgi:phosphoribosyl-ATP pyrophosphohydrolase